VHKNEHQILISKPHATYTSHGRSNTHVSDSILFLSKNWTSR